MRLSVLDTVILLGAAVVGALPVLLAGDPALALAWLALWAVPAGALVGSTAAAFGAALVPIAWALAAARLALPAMVWPALVIAGLFAAGYGVGAWRPRWAWRSAGALLVLGATLAWLPGLGGLSGAGPPWSPRTAARLLGLAPTTIAIESAGIDWMHHPAVYAPVGTDRMGPDVRTAWRGFLAGPTLLLVGCVLAAAGRRAARSQPCRPGNSSAPFPNN